MSNRLSAIKDEIGTLLSAITVLNGYSFDFGTINPSDRAKIKYWPAANIMLKSEAPASDISRFHGYDVAQIEIEVFCKMSTVNSNPLDKMDDTYDTVLTAIKKKFHGAVSLPITGHAVLRYTGWRREASPSGDVFSPYRVFVMCEVLYNSNE